MSRIATKVMLASILLFVASTSLAEILLAENHLDKTQGESPQVWNRWLYQQILKHPAVVAESEKLQSANFAAQAQGKPIYNPELATELEREGEDRNLSLGVSQTIDWWDKQQVRKQQAELSRDAMHVSYQAVIQEKIAEALMALSSLKTAETRQRLAREQEAQMDAFLKLVEAQQKSGDLGQIDAELAYLAMSQRLQDSAEADAQLAQAKGALRALLPQASGAQNAIPDAFWKPQRDNSPTRLVEQHPLVKKAYAEWQATLAQADVIKREAKADPSLGLSGGKAGDDNTVGLNLSIPLYIRNDYSAETQAARREALAAEASYQAARQTQLALLEASASILDAYETRYQRWRTLIEPRLSNAATSLEKQWRAGDLSTPDYLLALKDRAESLQTGINLESEWHNAVIDWLTQSGHLIASVQPQ